MFVQAFGFVITLITRLFTFVFGIQLSDNLTFGGVIAGLIIATLAFGFIRQFIGLSHVSSNYSSLRKRENGGSE